MFNYILDRINSANFIQYPFKLLYLKNILKPEHFNAIINSTTVNMHANTTEILINKLQKQYESIDFPGCTINISDYVQWHKTGIGKFPPQTKEFSSSFGMSFRLTNTENDTIKQLLVSFSVKK